MVNHIQLNLLVVCVDYSDYLEDTIKHNLDLFDTLHIVTSSKDLATQELCLKYSGKINCIITDLFYSNGALFNKGSSINYALSTIERKNWILVGDADCLYPKNIKKDLINSDKNCLYTYRRKLVANKKHMYDIKNNVADPLGHHNKNVHLGIGYCQIFNFESRFFPKQNYYPTTSNNASTSDIAFSRNWPSKFRKVIESDYVLHLGELCKNWKGRKSPVWT